jgi:hypothetical protein
MIKKKQCTKCSKTLPVKLFDFRNKCTGTRRSQCRSCCRTIWRISYRTLHKARGVSRYQEVRGKSLRRKTKLVVGLSGCQICSYKACTRAIVYHHLKNKTRSLTLNAFTGSPKRLIVELRNCVQLCCRCHEEVHDGLIPITNIIKMNERMNEFLDSLDLNS